MKIQCLHTCITLNTVFFIIYPKFTSEQTYGVEGKNVTTENVLKPHEDKEVQGDGFSKSRRSNKIILEGVSNKQYFTPKSVKKKHKDDAEDNFYTDNADLQHYKYRPAVKKLKKQTKLTLIAAMHVSHSAFMNSRNEPRFNFTEDEMKKFKLWRKGIILYFIDEYSFDFTMRQKLRLILHNFNELTGLVFTELPSVPDDENERWVMFINRRGALSCQDYTTKSFTNTGVQRVVLGYDCLGSGAGALAATLLALTGVPPQHNSPDRDKYIDVIMENILPEKRDLFEILKDDEWLFHDIGYDFLSASHYDFFKYTSNGSATIIPKRTEDKEAFQIARNKLSSNDVWKIRMLYNYITLKTRKPTTDVCSHIFRPGSKFENFVPIKAGHIQPRNKPDKYLVKKSEENRYQRPVAADAKDKSKLSANFKMWDASRDTMSSSELTTTKRSKQRRIRVKPKQNKTWMMIASDFDTDRN